VRLRLPSKPVRTVHLLALTAVFTAVQIAWSATSAEAASTLTAAQAKSHIGESATVCGKVVSTKFSERSKGEPTFLNLDEPYPDQVFTVLIWGSDRGQFGAPEKTYAGQAICVTGMIKEFRGKAEIIVHEPAQISKK
jgi:DNA/RNA endonuclease YhcR with UshA esterase domain